MKLNQPTKLVWFISLALGIIGVVLTFLKISPWDFWVMAVAWVLLVLGTVLKGF